MLRSYIAVGLVVGASLVLFLGGCATTSQVQSTVENDCQSSSLRATACNVVQGYGGNGVSPSAEGSTIAGGGEPALPNRVVGDFGAVSGGADNTAGRLAAVAGGMSNRATGLRSAIGGGSNNSAGSDYTTIGGGVNNIASYLQATVGGGANNTASWRSATVAGGSGNTASFTDATVGGGAYNTASSIESTVGGGSRNTASGSYSTVAGGSSNAATGFNSTVAGGSGNDVPADNGSIGGGVANHVTDKYGVVSGGEDNSSGNGNADPLDAAYGTVGGGSHNAATGLGATVTGGIGSTASGDYSVVVGGSSNSAGARYSLAAGRRANVRPGDDGAFLFADSSDAAFDSSAPNEFAVRAIGGVRLVTGIDPSGQPAAGARLPAGGGAWESLSDRDAKTNIVPVDPTEVLERLISIPISRWSYKAQDPSVQHIGPMAQDFYAAFDVGSDTRYISTVDEEGVALAAVQGLYRVAWQKDAEIAAQQNRISSLEVQLALQQSKIAGLNARLSALEKGMSTTRPLTPASPSGLPQVWLLLGGLGALALSKLRQS